MLGGFWAWASVLIGRRMLVGSLSQGVSTQASRLGKVEIVGRVHVEEDCAMLEPPT